MKTKFLILTSFAMCFSLIGCNKVNNSQVSNDSTNDSSGSELNPDTSGDVATTPENIKAFAKLESLIQYSVNIQDATSLGLRKESPASSKRDTHKGDFETTQTLVKTTTEYDPLNPSVGEDGTLDVSFNKIDTTVTTKLVDGQKTLIAFNDSKIENEVKIISYGVDSITFKSDDNHEYCAINANGEAVTSWIQGNGNTMTISGLPVNNSPRLSDLIVEEKRTDNGHIETVSFSVSGPDSIRFFGECALDDSLHYFYRVIDENGNVYVDWTEFETTGYHDLTINCPEPVTSKSFSISGRTLNAVITYPAYEGFKYTLKDKNGTEIVSSISLDDAKNISKDKSRIVIGDLVEGEKYTMSYHGVGEETTITQTTVGGEIDKLYVYNDQFTFASFVPYGTSKRPIGNDLKYGKDGIALYDKKDYYSDSNRLSFIFDNYSGYIYLIKNVHIDFIYNNLLLCNSDDFIYDFKIDENNNLIVFTLFSNKDVTYFNFFKDKYGTNVIQNDTLNLYDEQTNTHYFCQEPDQDTQTFIYSHGEYECFDELEDQSIRVKIYSVTFDSNRDLGKSYFLTSDNRILYCNYAEPYFAIPSSDNYIVLPSNEKQALTISDNFYTNTNYRSCTYTFMKVNDGVIKSYSFSEKTFNYSGIHIMFYDFINDEHYYFGFSGTQQLFNVQYIPEFDICLFYDIPTRTVYSRKIGNPWDSFVLEGCGFGNGIVIHREYIFPLEDCDVVLEDTDINTAHTEFLKYGVNGNTYYDIVAEVVNNEIEINSYVSGTYIAPEIKIILQPINR